EQGPPSGWNFTSLSCTGGGSNTSIGGQTATIGVDPGEDIVCTFTNTKQARDRTEQESIGGTGTLRCTDAVRSGPARIATVTERPAARATVNTVPPRRSSDLEQGPPSGWNFTSLTCTGGGSNTSISGQTATIGVDPGEDIVCTFTNT